MSFVKSLALAFALAVTARAERAAGSLGFGKLAAGSEGQACCVRPEKNVEMTSPAFVQEANAIMDDLVRTGAYDRNESDISPSLQEGCQLVFFNRLCRSRGQFLAYRGSLLIFLVPSAVVTQ
ncbi:unnamed protein product [Effrenium voratum]|nr:unnamed protein product [Effrenium voratum]